MTSSYYKTGNDEDNLIRGTSASEIIDGFGGDDILIGGDGDDIISGGSGTNTLYGDAGNDTITSSGTNDVVYAVKVITSSLLPLITVRIHLALETILIPSNLVLKVI